MGSAFGQRWARSYGGKMAAEIKRTWKYVLRNCTDASIRAGLAEAIESADGNVPTAGQFLAICNNAAKRLRDARPPAQAQAPAAEPVADRSERTRAWNACQSALARRMVGRTVVGSSTYGGSFPVAQVIAAVDLPDGTKLPDHERAFAALRRVFDEEWNLRTNGEREVAS